MASPRIALFRTHTIQSATATYLSPFPNSPPDTAESVSLTPAVVSSNENLSKITDLSSEALGMMKQLNEMQCKYDSRIKIQREMVEEEYKKRQMRKKLEETKEK